MTLVFLGQVPRIQISAILREVNTLPVPTFTLQLTHMEYWKRLKLLCCCVEIPPMTLLSLQATLQQALAGCGFEPESRPFKPHVTLARRLPYDFSQPLDVPLAWTVKGFSLIQSSSRGRAPQYTELWNSTAGLLN